MATTLQPPVRPASTPQQARLAELISARDGLIRDKIALQNQAKNLTIPLLKRQHKQRLDKIGRHIAKLDSELADTVPANQPMARRNDIISCIVAIGFRKDGKGGR